MQLISWSTLSQGYLVSQVTYLYFLHFKSHYLWEPNKAHTHVIQSSLYSLVRSYALPIPDQLDHTKKILQARSEAPCDHGGGARNGSRDG
jgi:hypothetical protein